MSLINTDKAVKADIYTRKETNFNLDIVLTNTDDTAFDTTGYTFEFEVSGLFTLTSGSGLTVSSNTITLDRDLSTFASDFYYYKLKATLSGNDAEYWLDGDFRIFSDDDVDNTTTSITLQVSTGGSSINLTVNTSAFKPLKSFTALTLSETETVSGDTSGNITINNETVQISTDQGAEIEVAQPSGQSHEMPFTGTGWRVLNFPKKTGTNNTLIPTADQTGAIYFYRLPSGSIDVSYNALSSKYVQDVTNPVFSNVSVTNIQATSAQFNAQINETGTIFWAVYPTADAQKTNTEIEAGTGAVSFGSIATTGGSIENDSATGLTESTDYRFHYFARDSSTNESAGARTSEFSTLSASIIIFSDLFPGPSLDTAKWTDRSNSAGTVSINAGKLRITHTSGTGTANQGYDVRPGVESIEISSTTDLFVVSFILDWSNTSSIVITCGPDEGDFSGNNYALATRTAVSVFTDHKNIVNDGGVNEVSFETSFARNTRVKIIYNKSTKAVSYFYWNGSSWTASSTGNIAGMGTTIKLGLLMFVGTDDGTYTCDFDDVYVSNADYATELPT